MNIHEAIKEARIAKGWSQTQLADAVSKAEGLKRPLVYQTVQQWESGGSAPKRTRLATVIDILGIDPLAMHMPVTTVVQARELTPPSYVQPVALPGRSTTLGLLLQLGKIMEVCDQPTRDAAAAFVANLCRDPQSAETMARKVVSVLDEPGNTAAQKSTNSPSISVG